MVRLFNVYVNVKLSRDYIVKADSWEDACDYVQDLVDRGEINLTPTEDFCETDVDCEYELTEKEADKLVVKADFDATKEKEVK